MLRVISFWVQQQRLQAIFLRDDPRQRFVARKQGLKAQAVKLNVMMGLLSQQIDLPHQYHLPHPPASQHAECQRQRQARPEPVPGSAGLGGKYGGDTHPLRSVLSSPR